jgi:predicted transcriptional regulator
MQQLTNAEEQMEHLWNWRKPLWKIYSDHFQNHQTTTVATLLKRMIDKDFVAYTEFGNSENTIHGTKTAYFSKHVNS